jgi:threonine dehydrogenase-like Zn-dependent dehydrogenase
MKCESFSVLPTSPASAAAAEERAEPGEAWGLWFDPTPARVAWQRLYPAGAVGAAMASLRAGPLPSPPKPAREHHWVPVRPRLAGVCGSDWAALTGRASPYLAAVTSFPAVLGHEVVGEVAGPAPWPAGTRVVVNPALSCQSFALPPCRACRRGDPDHCERRSDPAFGPGLLIGYHHELPGGWSTCMWAPRDQLHPVPPGLSDRRAVLTEPTAVVLNALSRVAWQKVERALVIGCGPMGLLTVWAMSEGHPALLGAEEVSDGNPEGWEPAVLGMSSPGLWGAPTWHSAGFDLIVDSVGSEESLGQSLRWARPGGQVLLLGGAGPSRLDLSPLWSRNLTWVGAYGYGAAGAGTFTAALRLLAATRRPVERIVGEVAPLDAYRTALPAFWRRRHQAIKLALAPPGVSPDL